MQIDKQKRQTLLSWLFVCLLVLLAATLGVLQYRWIGEVSVAERQRLRASLESSLHRLSLDFNSELAAACAAIMGNPFPGGNETTGDAGYTVRFLRWRETSRHNGIFKRIAQVVPGGEGPVLSMLNQDSGTFETAPWPPDWKATEERITARLERDSREPRRFMPGPEETAMIELPRLVRPEPPPEGFNGRPPGRERREPPSVPRLLFEVDLDYVRSTLLPELLQRHLGSGGRQEYQIEVSARDPASTLLYSEGLANGKRIADTADAGVNLFEVSFDQIIRRGGMFRGRGGRGGPPREGMEPDRGRWQLLVRHRAGSLDAVVTQVRRRNLAVTTGILVLMLATILALVRFTQRAQRLAQLQMDFVAGVSHELRTPLTVIRTAGHNLSGGLVTSGKQVQRYGALVRDEAERLTTIVEQVLRFASAKAGRTIGAREPVAVEPLVDAALAPGATGLDPSRWKVEKSIAADLPPILADAVSLKHALQNLLGNAVKYGSDGGWIGVSAALVEDAKEPMVEIRVTDRGPGIPPEEIEHVFDPFYRGRWALDNQIHGTGLGLSLVKRIVEAHGGTVEVRSEPGQGAEFVLRIPVALTGQVDEFANSAG